MLRHDKSHSRKFTHFYKKSFYEMLFCSEFLKKKFKQPEQYKKKFIVYYARNAITTVHKIRPHARIRPCPCSRTTRGAVYPPYAHRRVMQLRNERNASLTFPCFYIIEIPRAILLPPCAISPGGFSHRRVPSFISGHP